MRLICGMGGGPSPLFMESQLTTKDTLTRVKEHFSGRESRINGGHKDGKRNSLLLGAPAILSVLSSSARCLNSTGRMNTAPPRDTLSFDALEPMHV